MTQYTRTRRSVLFKKRRLIVRSRSRKSGTSAVSSDDDKNVSLQAFRQYFETHRNDLMNIHWFPLKTVLFYMINVRITLKNG